MQVWSWRMGDVAWVGVGGTTASWTCWKWWVDRPVLEPINTGAKQLLEGATHPAPPTRNLLRIAWGIWIIAHANVLSERSEFRVPSSEFRNVLVCLH